jgi:hypothetical protein
MSVPSTHTEVAYMSRNHTYRQQALTSQAWDNLNAAVESARHSSRVAGRRAAGLVDDASGRVGSGAKEARLRANLALDALAGRRPSTPWAKLALFAALGVAAGWAVTTFGRRRPFTVHDDLADLADDTPVDLASLHR